jgi:hypothetical protein
MTNQLARDHKNDVIGDTSGQVGYPLQMPGRREKTAGPSNCFDVVARAVPRISSAPQVDRAYGDWQNIVLLSP